MATDFDDFIKEFKGLRDDIVYGMGRIQGIRGHSPQERRNSHLMNHRPTASTFKNDDKILAGVGGFVEEIKSHVFGVTVHNLRSDLTIPLIRKMEDLHLDNTVLDDQRHYSNQTYMIAILRELQNLQYENRRLSVYSIRAHVNMFFRHAMWNTLVGSVKAVGFLVKPLFQGLRFLFLGGRKQDPQIRILKAIQEQTEFMRTGEIGGPRSFLRTLREGGLIGMAGRAILGSTLSETREDAQRRQNLRDTGRGDEINTSMVTAVADWLYRRDVTRRTTTSRINETSGSPIHNLVENIRDILSEIRILSEQSVLSLTSQEKQFLDFGKISTGVLEAVKVGNTYTVDGVKQNQRVFQYDKKLQEERTPLLLDMQNHIRRTDRNTRETARETGRLRRQQLMATLVNALGSIGNMVATAVSGALRSITGLLGSLPAAIAAAVLGRKLKPPRLPMRFRMPRAGILGTIATGLGLASIMSSDAEPEEKEEAAWSLGGHLAGMWAGGKTGAVLAARTTKNPWAIAAGGLTGGVLGGFAGEEAVDRARLGAEGIESQIIDRISSFRENALKSPFSLALDAGKKLDQRINPDKYREEEKPSFMDRFSAFNPMTRFQQIKNNRAFNEQYGNTAINAIGGLRGPFASSGLAMGQQRREDLISPIADRTTIRNLELQTGTHDGIFSLGEKTDETNSYLKTIADALKDMNRRRESIQDDVVDNSGVMEAIKGRFGQTGGNYGL